MDTPIAKRPAYVRYRWYIVGGTVLLGLIIYVIAISAGGQKLRVDTENLMVADVVFDKFLEYVETEGVVQPILTLQVNTRENGSVDRVVPEEGNMIEKGDTILVLTNPELVRTINDKKDEWDKQLIAFREDEIATEKESIRLKQAMLGAHYELKKLEKKFEVDLEEYNMGAMSKAMMEMNRAEFEYQTQVAEMNLENLHHDSVSAMLKTQIRQSEMDREQKVFEREQERLDHLVVRAPISGRLSQIMGTPGQMVGASAAIAEIKVLDPVKISTSISEYYIDRVVTGSPASLTWQGKRYPLRITKVVSEVKERSFPVDMVFTEERPDNVSIGKNFRVRIELDQAEDAVIIPRGDFFPVTGGQWIYKLNPSGTKALKTSITIGRQNPQQYEVTSGLQADDKIIVSGYANFGDAAELLLK